MESERLAKIDQVFQSALDLPTERRSEFLDAQCGTDNDLRAEVGSLISAHENAGEFIENSASDMAAALIDTASRHPTRVGQYKIEKLLGSGGMGDVYLAIDRINRRVALKLLSSRIQNDRDHLSRFLQEARTVVAINHPNIVTVFDVGESEGIYYIASELIEGENLREYLQNRQLPVNEVLEIVMQVASALVAAHEKGIIHRDIKPENVMIRLDGYVKVLDFGIAKLTEQFAEPVTTNAATRVKFETAEGFVIGTASHMSPEQARGERVDGRTDIWSCGVLLYEMLTGSPPFGGGTPAEVIARVLEREPPTLAHFLSNTSALQPIVNKCLTKDREERYQTAKDFVADLRSVKQEIEFAAKLSQPPGTLESSATAVLQSMKAQGIAKPGAGDAKRHLSSAEYIVTEIKQHRRGVVLTLSAVVLAVIGISYWFLYTRARALTRIDSVAVLPFVNETDSSEVEYLSDGISESLINSLSQIPNVSVKSRAAVFRYKGNNVEPQQIASQLSVQAVVTGRVVKRGDELVLYLSLINGFTGDQIWGDQYRRRLENLIELQQEIARDVSSKLGAPLSGSEEKKVTKSYTSNAEAYQLYLKGRYHVLKLTLAEIQMGISFFRQAIALDPSYALAYVGLADAYRSSLAGDMPPTEVLPKAKEAAQKAIEIDESLADAHAELGFIIFWYDWDWNAAENQFKRAIELDPNSVDSHLFYAHLLSNVGRHTEALEEVKRARELDPLDIRTNALEGQFLLHAGRTDDALGRLQKALQMAPNHYLVHFLNASANIEKGRYAEAIAEAQKAREISGPNSHPIGFLGYAFAKSGDQPAARNLLGELLKSSREHYVSPYNIALIYAALNERTEAFAWLEKAFQLRDQRLVFLKVEPKWDNLRNEPQFQDMLGRLQLK
jgi:eukaryotic-like serine/threonine-protein kinase